MRKLFHIVFIVLIMLLPVHRAGGQGTGTGKRPKVGLVLSGGAAKGMAHVGVLKVIEEAGLKIDYIGGTSMGGLVSALYAIGYDADSLAGLVSSVDWDRLLSDDIRRRDLSIEEKPDYDRFIVSFPLRERKVKLPAGVVSGQNIENLFAELCSHVHNIQDFNQFQIPLLCVSVDVATGTEVVHRDGYLPNAMRATMAIPSVFTPVSIDGRLLIDGGVVNNFPVDHVQEMGADILIGVNVGHQPFTAEDEVNFLRVMEQTVFLASNKLTKENIQLCDIYIAPDITGYSSTSFNAGDSLITRGERAARVYFDRFKSLADSLNNIEYIPYVRPSFEPLDSFLLSEIHIDGIEKVSGKLLRGRLNLNVLEKYTPQQVSEAIDNVYSSLFFEKVTYELEPLYDEVLGPSVKLRINVKERRGGQLMVGLNYNTSYKASITLNTTFRNVLLNGTKLSLNVALGENQFFLARYEKNNGWRPGFVLDMGGQNFDLNIYTDGTKKGVIDYADIGAAIYTRSIIGKSYAFGFGGEVERITLRPDVGDVMPGKEAGNFYNLLGYIDLDTYDNRFFPTVGTRFNSLYKFITDQDLNSNHFLRLEFEQAARLGKRFTLLPRAYGGISTADSSLRIYQFYLGGLNRTQRKGILPFAGLDFMENSGRNAVVLGLDLQYNFWRSNYLVLRTNVGNTSWELEDILVLESAFSGFGLTLGNMSLIGPIEFTLMRSNLRNEFLFYINIGYYF
jgi:NTE family protein